MNLTNFLIDITYDEDYCLNIMWYISLQSMASHHANNTDETVAQSPYRFNSTPVRGSNYADM